MKSMIIRNVMAVGCMALLLWVVSCSNANTAAAEDEVNSDSAEVQTEQIVWGDIGLPIMYTVHTLQMYVGKLEEKSPELEYYLEIDKGSNSVDSLGSLKRAKMYIQEFSSWRYDRVLSGDDLLLLKIFSVVDLYPMINQLDDAARKALKKRGFASDKIETWLYMQGKLVLFDDIADMIKSLQIGTITKDEFIDLYVERERIFSELQAKGE